MKAEPAARPDRDKRKAVPPPPPRPVRDRGNAVTVEEEIPEVPAPAPKPEDGSDSEPEPLAPAAAASDAPMIGLPQAERSGVSKIAIVAAAFVVLAGGGYFMFSGSKSAGAGSADQRLHFRNVGSGNGASAEVDGLRPGELTPE